MIKRTLFISNAVCLSYKSKQLLIKNADSDSLSSIPVEDIGYVIIENNQVYITIPAINALAQNNASVIFCDEAHMPLSMNLPLECNSIQNQLFTAQINANEPIKKRSWKMVIEQKIKNQIRVLEKNNLPTEKLYSLAKNVKSDDSTNREACAAKLYWDYLFGSSWTRDRYGDYPNNLLNYGYAILRAATARALVGSGLLPTLGIHHHNKYNAFALADDIMEPYRPFVDDMVMDFIRGNPEKKEVCTDYKKFILTLLTRDVFFLKTTRPLMVGLSHTTSSLAKVFSGTAEKIIFPSLV